MIDRGYLEAHLERRVPLQYQYVVKSNKMRSMILIEYLQHDQGLAIIDFNFYHDHPNELFDRILHYKGPWGVFHVEVG